MLETLTDRVAAKGVSVLERILDGDGAVSGQQARAAMSAVGHEIKLRGTVNRDVSNAITVVKMHPDKAVRELAADRLLRRLLPEMPASGAVTGTSQPALAGQSNQ